MPEFSESGPVPNPRLRRFLHAVASGYAQLIANVLYVLASVPLALHFLEKREFGLWALAVQLGGYLQLIDLGMSASVSRHLVDYKDRRDTGEYGGMIKTGGLVLLAQALLVLAGGALVILYGTQFLRIDPDLERPFKIVMLLQCAILALDFPARLFGHVLIAHQRADISNYSQMVLFLVSYGVLWYCFTHGFGIYSLVWANAAGWSTNALSNLIACSVLKILPARGAWGRLSSAKFRELFRFGKDLFWIALGVQMINASQTIVVTRTLGLDSAAIWSICTRAYTLANQLVWRPFDFSYPMLSEMVARGEKDRLLHRFKGLVILTTSLAVVAAVMFALCNGPFVALWTHGKISWSIDNNVLLAVWMVVLALVHCHCGLVVITKRIGFMRYIYFFEGITFLIIGGYASARWGFAGLLVTSICCSLTFSFSYGIRRTKQEFDLSLEEVLLRWLAPPARLSLPLGLVALLLYWTGRNFPTNLQLLFYIVFAGTAGVFFFFRHGLSSELSSELGKRVPPRLSGLFRKLFPGS